MSRRFVSHQVCTLTFLACMTIRSRREVRVGRSSKGLLACASPSRHTSAPRMFLATPPYSIPLCVFASARALGKDCTHGVVQDLPIEELGFAAADWIESFYDSPHPLMATYALDTTQFIEAHAKGKHFSQATLRGVIPAMVDGHLSFDRIYSSTFKYNFTTRNIGGTEVFVQIPDGGSLFASAREVLLGPGEKFLFRVKRCHLSESWGANCDAIVFGSEQDQPKYDIAESMLFVGEILRSKLSHGTDFWKSFRSNIADSLGDVENFGGIPSSIPVRWITHVVKDQELLPVPNWREAAIPRTVAASGLVPESVADTR